MHGSKTAHHREDGGNISFKRIFAAELQTLALLSVPDLMDIDKYIDLFPDLVAERMQTSSAP